MAVVNNRLEEFSVSILTFIWQERIYCSACYNFECNLDDVQLFKWMWSYRDGTIHEDEEGLGIV